MFNPNLEKTRSKQEFIEECHRWNSLTVEEQQAECDAYMSEIRESFKKEVEERKQKEYEKSLKGAECSYVYSDTVNSLENSEATIIWIVVMLVSALFKDGWIMWIVATIMWLSHICRYKIRKAKWDDEGKVQWEEEFKNGGK